MVPSPKMCNRFLPSKENNPHRLCTVCRGKTYDIEDLCEDCHNWPDEKCCCVGEYLAKLSAQREKKHGRKAKASSSFFFFQDSPLLCLPLCVSCHPYCVQVQKPWLRRLWCAG